MPRILRIINRFNLGGPTYNAAYLSRYLAPEFETLLIGGVPQPSEAHSGFIPESLGVPYTEIPSMGRALHPLHDLESCRAILRIIREFRPDVVHTHASKAGALGRLAARAAGVPAIVHTFHGHVFEGYFSPWKSRLICSAERYLARYSHAIIAISDRQRDDLIRRFAIAPEAKVRLIPLGFDLDRFTTDKETHRAAFRMRYHLQPHECAVGIIGRLAPVKDHDLFLRALAGARKQAPHLRAFIIGDGALRIPLMALCSQLGLTTSDGSHPADVVFTSWIENIPPVLHGLDMVALSSLNEGTPVSLIEAQAAALPVISTDVGGVRDVVTDGVTGLITPPGSAAAMTDALVCLAGDPMLRAELGQAGQAFVFPRYHYQRLVADTRELYLRLIS